ncbi:prepilin-type N-terminal cleavage/methylation domain-containing protein [Schinkia azotoformans]|uniref:Prepilin-type N-terminal cleavage/methylation domain-containing protein n=1 Tax=Schinkia azotoformans LMG 9581 TaxID=1131731 RepID=K6DVW9_SCHAZ|nr:prepilin-type N-terminal cleavage/methylation domain-containing protein [Schinkia azotoformans]EKN64976.1 hypothetical protein BAZO_12269 [Schinkia azotoformans LMG 9581]MEC1640248.1 prepilin-type N-terminal cleavage/methylation domain-containing protein [Schinkia azotoformans]MEC1945597.1 prepilin-type N-terminal cleavage/methylation domain-containing protein [Schinkia azotoformans]
MLKRILKNEKGLTLIELLAVVVILGIIAAIAVPAIGKIIDDSRQKAVVSDALQIINASKIAKAQNPSKNKFDGTGGDDAVDLDDYLDSPLPTGVVVTFDATSGQWSINGHTKLESANTQYSLGFTDGTNGISETDLVDFLENGKKAATGG